MIVVSLQIVKDVVDAMDMHSIAWTVDWVMSTNTDCLPADTISSNLSVQAKILLPSSNSNSTRLPFHCMENLFFLTKS